MSMSSSPVYCPLIQQMLNASEPSNSSARASALSLGTVCLHGLVSSLGILENLLILGVIGLQVQRSVISIWVLNLAASDLLATASLPFFTVFLAQGSTWTLGTTFCRLHSSVFFLSMFVSAFLLAAISLDRCLVVLRPVWTHNHRNVRLVRRVCGVIWAMAVICTVPFYLFRDTIPQRNGKVMCYYNYARFLPPGDINLKGLCEVRQEALALIKFLLAFLLPLVVIIGSYVTLAVNLARRSRGKRQSFRFMRLVVAVVVSFVVCWAPYHVFSILEAVVHHQPSLLVLLARGMPITASIAFLNSVINPVLYVFSCPDLCSKIRQSLGTVLETVLAEDLGEWSRRRSTAGTLISALEFLPKGRGLLIPSNLMEADSREDGGEEDSYSTKESSCPEFSPDASFDGP